MSKQIAQLLDGMSLDEFNNFIESLSNSEFIFLKTKLLVEMEDKGKQNLFAAVEQKASTPERGTPVANERELQGAIHRKLMLQQLNELNEELIEALLGQLQKNELVIILSILKESQDVRSGLITFRIETALAAKGQKNPLVPEPDESEYHKSWRDLHAKWRPERWNDIYKKLKDTQAKSEPVLAQDVEPIVSEPDAPLREKPKKKAAKQSFFSRYIWSSDDYFTQNAAKRTEQSAGQPQPQRKKAVKPSAEENRLFAEIAAHGAISVEQFSEEGIDRARANRERSAHTRFGITISSQAGVYVKGGRHAGGLLVLRSLAQIGDGDKETAALSSALRNLLPSDESDVLSGQNMFNWGGNSTLLSAIESADFDKLLTSDSVDKYGLELSDEDRRRIEKYKQGIDRSRELNLAITSNYNLGNYTSSATEKGGYEPIEDKEKFERLSGVFEKNLTALASKLVENCGQLKEGETILLDTGLKLHAMKISITLKNGNFELSCYDSGGHLYNSIASERIGGVFKLRALGSDGKRSNGLKFTVSPAKLLSEEGLGYFRKLLRENSAAGIYDAERAAKQRPPTSVDKFLNYFIDRSKRDPSQEGFFSGLWTKFSKFLVKSFGMETLAAGKAKSKVYLNYIDTFTAISDPESPPTFDTVEQHIQNTGNCFTKRAQTCQLYELGTPTYKKVRKAILIEQRDKTLEDILGATPGERQNPLFHDEYKFMFENIREEILSPEELFQASMQLYEITGLSADRAAVPSAEYYRKFFKNLLDARALLLAKPEQSEADTIAIKRIEEKLSKYATDFHKYLVDHGKDGRIDQVFTPEFIAGSFSWDSGELPFAIPKDTAIDKSAAINQLAEFATATAWRSSILVNNHLIAKLSVPEHYTVDPAHKLDTAGYFETRALSLEDLQQAKVISYTQGFGNKEVIQVAVKIGDVLKEVDKVKFFELVAANKEALGDSKVMALLNYLRNVSPEMEQQYIKIVYPAQNAIFQEKLVAQIEQSEQAIRQGLGVLVEYDQRLNELLASSLNFENQLKAKMAPLQAMVTSSKRANLELKDLAAQLSLVQGDSAHIRALIAGVATEKTRLEGTGPGSVQGIVARNKSLLTSLKQPTTDRHTIKHVVSDYMVAESDLSALRAGIAQKWRNLELDEVQLLLQERHASIRDYCKGILKNNLNANPEYRLLQDLATGNLGSEKDRDITIYPTPFSKDEHHGPGYQEGSVFLKIQNLNQRLQETILARYTENLVTLVSNGTITEKERALIEANAEYGQIWDSAKNLSNSGIPLDLKKKWVEEMFHIWLEHEQDSVLSEIVKQQGDDLKLTAEINRAFLHFIEQKTDVKLATLQQVLGLDIALTRTRIDELGWSPDKIIARESLREEAADILITSYKKRFAKKNASRVEATVVQTQRPSIHAENIMPSALDSQMFQGFPAPKVTFLSREQREAVDANTLKFLRNNTPPILAGSSESDYHTYVANVTQHIDKLINYKGLENKNERVLELCISAAKVIAPSTHQSDVTNTRKIVNALTDLYRDKDQSINESFMRLENGERAQLLATLLKFSLASLRAAPGEKIKVNPKFYSMVKQWENLVIPRDRQVSQMVGQLISDPTGAAPAPEDLKLLEEVDTAIHLSPIGLEGIYEGQQGLLSSLSTFGAKKGIYDANEEAVVDERGYTRLRAIADAVLMRNGKALLPSQFINYYQNKLVLYSQEGIHSSQGREFFSRAFLDAFQHATTEERRSLIKFLKSVEGDDRCLLKTKNKVFCAELLFKCYAIDSVVDPAVTLADVATSKSLIERAITEDTSSKKGEQRLFGFAKEINYLANQIEKVKALGEDHKLDELYSRLICANLAYQLLLEQADEQVLESYSKNFEYKKEMSLVQANINRLQESLVDFSCKLKTMSLDEVNSSRLQDSPAVFAAKQDNSNRVSTFKRVLNEYQTAEKFDGTPINVVKIQSSTIPGFISLGGIDSLDVLHGAIYIGDNKKGVMPAHIQAHISLQVLGLGNLTFKPEAGGYVYKKDGVEKAYVTQIEDGTLVIQRELDTFDGSKMLQYLSPEHLSTLPTTLKTRVNAEHFFMDEEGAIHAFSSDFTPIMKMSLDGDEWVGELIDHQNEKVSIRIATGIVANEIADKLSQLFPYEEMITIDEDTIYIPALQKYVARAEKDNEFYLMDRPSDSDSRSTLTVVGGVGYAQKTLTAANRKEIEKLNKDIQKYETEIAEVKSDKLDSLVARYRIQKLDEKIDKCREQIHQIEAHQCFVFVPDDADIHNQEKHCDSLLAAMNSAYMSTVQGGLDKEKAAARYETAKADYLEALKELRKSIEHANHKIIYSVNRDKSIKPRDFQGILYLGQVDGSATIFLDALSKSIPQGPLSVSELANLRNIREVYEGTLADNKATDQVILCMLVGIELKHLLLEREQSLQGKPHHWDKGEFDKLKANFSSYVLKANGLLDPASFPTLLFNELWRDIKSEFNSSELTELEEVIAIKPVEPVHLPSVPLNINAKTIAMPIEALDMRAMVSCTHHGKLDIDEEQQALISKLSAPPPNQSTLEQIDGFYYENYGVFDSNTLTRFLKITDDLPGVGKITQQETKELLDLMRQLNWIEPSQLDGKYQLTKHPSEFFSSSTLAAFFTSKGFDSNNATLITERIGTFLYETAVKGVKYSIPLDKVDELKEKLSSQKANYELELMLAETSIKTFLDKADTDIPMAELYSAYLSNDYSRVLPYFPATEREAIQRGLNNALTRVMYYKTELDHLNDIIDKTKKGKYEEAISMLHIKRNYSLEKLLRSADSNYDIGTDGGALAAERDRKMQRAFLLFESEFGHRCNVRQVDIFRGLLLDDETDPDAIDAAQARMGFGKTSLLPLVALYKAGNGKLVRFVVPKSALETNTAAMSSMLDQILGTRAVKDDFRRLQPAHDPEANMGEQSPRLQSMRDAKAELKKRLDLYRRVRDNGEVLFQSPSVRNAIACQLKIFSKEYLSAEGEQEKVLRECITLLSEIRTIETITLFDELDATQDPNTTEVNYTTGAKPPFNQKAIQPLELITETICSLADKSPASLAQAMLDKFGIVDTEDHQILHYITSKQNDKPEAVTDENKVPIYLMRAVLTDPAFLAVFIEKQPCTDFGVWFENSSSGEKIYDYIPVDSDTESGLTQPLLIAVPYSAANTPKPQGSRYDNPEVTAITTFLYYLDQRTKIEQAPHLEFLIASLKTRDIETVLFDSTGKIAPEFERLFAEIKEIANIEDSLTRNKARSAFFEKYLGDEAEDPTQQAAFRKMLARVVIKEQVKCDASKANSNRCERGTSEDKRKGFSGTTSDVSSDFTSSRPDAAADGNMTFGIMGRKNCQKTMTLPTSIAADAESDYTTMLLKQIFNTKQNPSARTFIDVGGLCKATNNEVAKIIAAQLQKSACPIKNLKGVIFYDDITNTKKLLPLEPDAEPIDLTPEMEKESEQSGSYFTYYDQAHSRGADIKQMDGAHAVLSLSFTVTNNDYKQAIMRMRSIITKASEQSFSIAVPDIVRQKILTDLKYSDTYTLTGNDIAFWLRTRELADSPNPVSTIKMELDAIIDNAVFEQQAIITKLLAGRQELDAEEILVFHNFMNELDKVSNFISESATDLESRYGRSFKPTQKSVFLQKIEEGFQDKLKQLFAAVREVGDKLKLKESELGTDKAYRAQGAHIIQRRGPALSDTFMMPSVTGRATSESHAEVESSAQNQKLNQQQSQNQVKSQSHSMAQVSQEDVHGSPELEKPDVVKPVSIDFLASPNKTNALTHASAIPTIKHLFEAADSIKCSTVYQQLYDTKKMTPPIRYFIAREDGEPKVILINQDEADLFKASGDTSWSLYDLHSIKTEVDELRPICGEVIDLDEGLFKKLRFASYRHAVDSADLNTIGDSLGGICTPEQLMPTLVMSVTHDGQPVDDPNSLFSFSEWGFKGDASQTLQCSIEQTHEVHKGIGLKEGVTLRFGEDIEVFIASRLNDRILAALDKPAVQNLHLMTESPEDLSPYNESYIFINKEGTKALYYINRDGVREKVTINDFHLFQERITSLNSQSGAKLLQLSDVQVKELITSNGGHTPPAQSKLRIMKDAVDERLTVLVSEKERLGSSIALLKQDKSKITIDSQKKLDALEQDKAKLIEAAKARVPEILRQKMEAALSLRKIVATQMRWDVQMDCLNGISLPTGIKTDAGVVKKFASLRDLLNTKLDLLAKDYPTVELASANKEAVTADLSAFLSSIISPVFGMHNNYSRVFKKDKPFIDAFKEELANQMERNKTAAKGKKKTTGQLKIWDSTIDEHFKNHFASALEGVSNPEARAALIECVKEAAKQCTEAGSVDNLEALIIEKIKATAATYGLGDGMVSAFISKLSCSLCMKENERHNAFDKRLNDEVQNILIGIILKRAKESAPELEPLLTEILGEKLKNTDPRLPQTLLNGATPSAEEMARIVSLIIKLQGVGTTDYQLQELTKACLSLKGQSEVIAQQILANFVCADKDKPRALVGPDGHPMELTGDYLQLITELDASVAKIDARIAQVKTERNDNLARIDGQLAESQPRFREVCDEFKGLKSIKAACNKLFVKLADWLPDFLKQICVKSEEVADPALFVERHFNLREIITNQRQASVELTVTSPDFYRVMDDMTAQRDSMHDFVAEEHTTSKDLIAARAVVALEASTVQPRGADAALALQEDLAADDRLSIACTTDDEEMSEDDGIALSSEYESVDLSGPELSESGQDVVSGAFEKHRRAHVDFKSRLREITAPEDEIREVLSNVPFK